MQSPDNSLSTTRLYINLFFFFYGFTFATWASRIPTIQLTLNLSETTLGAVLLAMPIGSFITLPFSGYLVSKLGSRKVVIVSSLVYGFLLVGIGFSNAVLPLVICMFLFGCSGNMFNISINTQALALQDLYKRTIISSFHGMWSVAGLVAAFIGTYLMGRAFPVHWHFLVIALVSMLVFLLCIPKLIKDNVTHRKKTPFFPKPGKALISLGIIAFCSMMCQGAMFDWSGVYFRKVVTTETAYIGLGYTAFMVSMTSVRFITDWLTNKIGLKKIIIGCGLLTTAGLCIAVFFPYLWLATLGMLLVGAGVSPVVPLVFSAAGKTRAGSPATAIAAVSSIGFIGLLIGPPLIGFIAGATSLKISFIILSILGLVITFVALIMKQKESATEAGAEKNELMEML